MTERSVTPATNGESSILDMTTPRDHLRWALVALDLTRNGLVNRGIRGDDDVETRNLKAARESVEQALELIRSSQSKPSETASSEGYPGIAHDMETMRAALAELVTLKSMKDGFGEEPFGDHNNAAALADYKRRKPLAWQAARDALKERAAPQGSAGTHRTDPAGPVADDAHAPAGAAPIAPSTAARSDRRALDYLIRRQLDNLGQAHHAFIAGTGKDPEKYSSTYSEAANLIRRLDAELDAAQALRSSTAVASDQTRKLLQDIRYEVQRVMMGARWERAYFTRLLERIGEALSAAPSATGHNDAE